MCSGAHAGALEHRASRDPQVDVVLARAGDDHARARRRARRGTARRPRARPRSSTARSTARARRGSDRRARRARPCARSRSRATPPTVPRQPACAAPITRASGSANRIGMQSAANAPSTGPGTIADQAVELRRDRAAARRPSTRPSRGRGGSPGAAPDRSRRAAASRRRFSSTLPRSSPQRSPRLSDARGPVDTPPVRSGNPCTKPSRGSTGDVWSRIEPTAALLPRPT